MKIIQLNAWGGRLSRQIIKFIEAENPDILCLQEISRSAAQVGYPEDQMFNLFGYIEQTGLFSHSFFSPTIEMNIADGTVEFGNAIFSKFPLSQTQTVFIDGSDVVRNFTQVENQAAGNNPARNAQLAILQINEKQQLALVNQHFHWALNPLGDQTSEHKMQEFAQHVKNFAPTSLPLLVCGDFNLKAESPAMQIFNGWLENLTARTGVASTLSGLKYPAQEVQVACDYVFANDKITVNQVEVKNVIISDHLPVVVEFDLS